MNVVARCAWATFTALVASGCAGEQDLTFTSPYSGLIGSQYRVVGSVVAYGIYANLDDRSAVSYIQLIPGQGIEGPEVAFKKHVPEGATVQILSAWRESKVLSSDVYYVAAIENVDLPRTVQVRIELSRGNEGTGGQLNPAVYERVNVSTVR